MQLVLNRVDANEKGTIGKLFVNGKFHCYTLEDVVRQIDGSPVTEWKVAGETAIPRGVYPVIVNMSKRFGRLLPLLVGVPGFEGVRIHPGNTTKDTEGCILVGQTRNENTLQASRAAFATLFPIISSAFSESETITISIS